MPIVNIYSKGRYIEDFEELCSEEYIPVNFFKTEYEEDTDYSEPEQVDPVEKVPFSIKFLIEKYLLFLFLKKKKG
jgi:hypothetical protein